MSRTIIDIPEPLLRSTDELCQRLGLSRAEVVRRALRDYLKHNEAIATDGFGLWADPDEAAADEAAAVSPQRNRQRSQRR